MRGTTFLLPRPPIDGEAGAGLAASFDGHPLSPRANLFRGIVRRVRTADCLDVELDVGLGLTVSTTLCLAPMGGLALASMARTTSLVQDRPILATVYPTQTPRGEWLADVSLETHDGRWRDLATLLRGSEEAAS